MAARKWSLEAFFGGLREATCKGNMPLEAYAKRMRVCGCVYVRSLHSKIPLKVEEELNPQMNTKPHFYSQTPLFILKR